MIHDIRPDWIEDVKNRFNKFVIKTSDCWNWNGSLNIGGYGKISIKHENKPAHRVSWIIHNGAIPEGLFVLHKCDVRDCVAPSHLFLGTHDDNMLDRANKGRTKPNNQTSKLSDKDKDELIAKYQNGISQNKLALEYKISQALVWKFIHRKIKTRNTRYMSKLTIDQKEEIKARFMKNETKKDLAKEFGLSLSGVRYILGEY